MFILAYCVSGPDLWPAVTVSIICFVPLVLMRAVRNLVAPPIVIITDSKEFAFNFPTRFRVDVSKMRKISSREIEPKKFYDGFSLRRRYACHFLMEIYEERK